MVAIIDIMTISSNEHYGRLNAQYDNRAGYLLNKGFKLVRCEEFDSAFWVRPAQPGYAKRMCLATAFVMNCDARVWADRCQDIERGF